MPRRANININADPAIIQQFRDMAAKYDNRIGMCLSAAMLMFLEAHPDDQADCLRRIFDAELRGRVNALLDEIRNTQSQRVRQRDETRNHSARRSRS